MLTRRHFVQAAAATAALLGPGPVQVASWHHQGISRLGRGLRAVAWADDGTVEAVEIGDWPSLWAVQWHPELQVEEPDGRQRRLFEALASAAAAARSPRSSSR